NAVDAHPWTRLLSRIEHKGIRPGDDHGLLDAQPGADALDVDRVFPRGQHAVVDTALGRRTVLARPAAGAFQTEDRLETVGRKEQRASQATVVQTHSSSAPDADQVRWKRRLRIV